MAISESVSHDSPVHRSPYLASWTALRLLNQYRLLTLFALAAMYYIAGDTNNLGIRDSVLFQRAHLFYLGLGITYATLVWKRWPSATTQVYLQSYLDIVCLAVLIYASGGIDSGLGLLMLVNIALLSQMIEVRHAFLFAAIASLIILAEEMITAQYHGYHAADLQQTALFGCLLFAVAWLMTVPLRYLLHRETTEPTRSRAALDVKQIAELNEEIIRELDSGVVVVDANAEVQLINDRARQLLSVEFSKVPMPLSRLCMPLLDSMRGALRTPGLSSQSFDIPYNGQAILPRYLPLSTGGMLIKLDDYTEIRHQYQQLKLASLGRLSASIAHEIRNPLGAISHAVQLLEESPVIDSKDADLLAIAQRHTARINRIVEDVLQLGSRRETRAEKLELATQVQTFRQRFLNENALPDASIKLGIAPGITVHFDPGHLDQILWNLCSNALTHNPETTVEITMEANESHEQGNAVIAATLDVRDNGRGICDIDREKLFEPFYSTHHSGSGLGLFIIRELCEMNNSRIECLPGEKGAHFRMSFSRARQLAA